MLETTTSLINVRSAELAELRSILPTKTVYCILDACGEIRIPAKVKDLGPERAVSLYRGKAELEHWAIAPYLVQVDEEILDWIVANFWKKPWGIFAVSPVPLAELRTHFRKFLTVLNPQGEKMYFRFYDPRVLPAFLETCVEQEVHAFFGSISTFWVTDESGELRSVAQSRST